MFKTVLRLSSAGLAAAVFINAASGNDKTEATSIAKLHKLQMVEKTYLSRPCTHASQKAIEIIDTIIKTDRNNAYAHFLKGLALQQQGQILDGRYESSFQSDVNYRKAVQEYDLAEGSGLKTARLFYMRGEAKLALYISKMVLANQGRLKEREQNTSNQWIWATRGMAFSFLGDKNSKKQDKTLTSALSDLDQSIKLDSANDEAWSTRAIARAAQGDIKGATADIKVAMEKNPRRTTNFYKFAMLSMHKKNYQAARLAMDRALTIHPQIPHFYLLRAQAEMAMRDYKAADSDISFVLSKDPENAAALTIQGLLRLNENQPEQAIADLNEASKIHKKVTASKQLDTKQGEISAALARQMLSETAKDYRKRKSPGRQALYELGVLEWGLRNWTASGNAFEEFLRLSPNSDETELHSVALYALALQSQNKYEQALALLRKYSNRSKRNSQASKIVLFLSGKCSVQELDSTPTNDQERALTNFYIGAKLAREGKNAMARERLVWVKNNANKELDQYLLAVIELDQLTLNPKEAGR